MKSILAVIFFCVFMNGPAQLIFKGKKPIVTVSDFYDDCKRKMMPELMHVLDSIAGVIMVDQKCNICVCVHSGGRVHPSGCRPTKGGCEVIQDYLLLKGIPENRMWFAARGEQEPWLIIEEKDNELEKMWKSLLNDRVEIYLDFHG